MFLVRRPRRETIDRFLQESGELSTSYGPIGIARTATNGHVDEMAVVIGRGKADFDRARRALRRWRQFEIGWVEIFPENASIEAGSVVAVLIRHFGFWSLNGNRVVLGGEDGEERFAYSCGTLTNHAESGEELFEITLDRGSEDVVYRIRAISRPRAMLARLGGPVVRALQSRFRRDSVAAMKRAIRSADA